MRKKFKFKKPTALIIAAALAVTGAVAVLGTTLAATEMSWTATTPAGAPTDDDYKVDIAQVKDDKLGKISITSLNASTWGSSDASVANYSGKSGNTGTFTARKPGLFVAYRSTTNGRLGNTPCMVYDSTKPYTYTITKDQSILDKAGATDTIPITMKDMNNKVITGAVTWTSSSTSVATVDTNGVVTAVADSGTAVMVGRFTDCYGQAAENISYSVVIGKVTNNDVVGPDGDGNYWKPVGVPEDVWEQVDKDGNPTKPPEYVYTPGGGNPIDGSTITPVEKGQDGKYYVEEPKNIWTPIADDGKLDKDNTVWGGDDFKPGTNDDKPAENFGSSSNPSYWAGFGENIYAQVSPSKGTIGALTGGGAMEDPSISLVRPIFDNTSVDGHYYYGPKTDTEGVTYYIGDDWKGSKGNGLMDSNSESSIHATDKVYYRKDDGTMTPDKPVTVIPATSIALGNPANTTITVGTKQAAPTVTVLPANATNQTVVWSSGNPAYATVNAETGEVTGIAPGSAVITATLTNPDNSKVTATYTLTVKAASVAATGITLGNPVSDTIVVGKTQAAPSVTITPSNATNKTIVWSSSNTGYATVNASTGVVTGKAPGVVVITATLTNPDNSKVTATYALTVKSASVPATGITLGNPASNIIMAGKTQAAPSVTVTPSTATNKTVVWSSGNTGVATVNASTGVVTGKAAGTVTITATLTNENGSKVTATYTLTVQVAATGITIGTLPNSTITVGNTQAAPSITVTPSNATNKTVVWSSSNTSYAAVNASTGIVTGKAAGTVTITATITNSDGTKATGSYTLTVKANPWKEIVATPGNTFTASGVEWVILKAEASGNALITTKDLQGTSIFGSTSNQYAISALKLAMEGFYDRLTTYDVLSKRNKETGVRYITDVAQPSNFLSVTPVWNATGGISTVSASGQKTCFALSYQEAVAYLKGKGWAKAGQKGASASIYWLRSPSDSYDAAVVLTSGAPHANTPNGYIHTSYSYGVRPALWIKLF